MSQKIVVPEEMLQAAMNSIRPNWAELVPPILQAALRWLSENPIVPTSHDVCSEMHRTINAKGYCCYQSALLAEWQRRMFVAPEPEIDRVDFYIRSSSGEYIPFTPNEGQKAMLGIMTEPEIPEEIADLMGADCITYGEGIDKIIIEAFRRGQKSK